MLGTIVIIGVTVINNGVVFIVEVVVMLYPHAVLQFEAISFCASISVI